MSLAVDWIKSAEIQLKRGSLEDAYAGPIVELLDLCGTSPRKALEVIYEIISCDPSDEIIGYLGAGPLEELLIYNCEQFIDELIEKSKIDERLMLCMKSVNLDDSECTRAKEFYDAIGE